MLLMMWMEGIMIILLRTSHSTKENDSVIIDTARE